MFAQTLAPGPRIAKGWGLLLCAIHKANVTVALLFQTLIEMKKGRPLHVRGRPLEPIGVLSGGEGGTPIHENKLGRVRLVPGMEK